MKHFKTKNYPISAVSFASRKPQQLFGLEQSWSGEILLFDTVKRICFKSCNE